MKKIVIVREKKTKEIGTQVEFNKNIEVEKLVEIIINIVESSEHKQEFNKANIFGKVY